MLCDACVFPADFFPTLHVKSPVSSVLSSLKWSLFDFVVCLFLFFNDFENLPTSLLPSPTVILSIVCRLLAVRLHLNRLSDRLSDVSFKLYLYSSKNRQTSSPTQWPWVNSPAKIMKLDNISIFCQIKSLSFRGTQLYFTKQISTKEPDVRRKLNKLFEWLSPVQ